MAASAAATPTDQLELSTRGTVWGFTVQRFAPKSPPYVAPEGGFVPFAVGYVDLPEGVKVEAVLDCSDFSELEGDAEVMLVADRAGSPLRHRGAPEERRR